MMLESVVSNSYRFLFSFFVTFMFEGDAMWTVGSFDQLIAWEANFNI